ncbi:MAG: protein-L-isoaspartate(D-aspartate) O-methyltransferase [Marinilabiliales bacterium]|nr:MAG: protein-L-isoaspartate(D-aspartate) O-methyltransferase [Marinilabiliales bacterium]
MTDSYRHKGLRRNLVEEIRSKGIEDERVLDAVLNVPRHYFMDTGFVKYAYKDQAFPIGCGQTISQPYTVAFQTELLEVEKHCKVLEVGTGSGYQAAILCEMGAKVFTIERHRDLFIRAQSLLTSMGYKATFFYGDGYEGKPAYGPFDRILVTAGAGEIPEKLKLQMKIGGIMVIPLGDSRCQVMTRIERMAEEEFKVTEHGRFVFVPLLKGKSG